MKLIFSETAWNEYLYWQSTDMKVTERINSLLKECSRTPFSGIGKPEPLKHELKGWWSRRIDLQHRLVYRVDESGLHIAKCRSHY